MEQYVLMIQTDPDDKYLTESSLSEMDNPVPVKFIENIEELDGFVVAEGLPALVLLNDRGVKSKGITTIKQLKEDPVYSHIPVVVLGEVSADDHIRQWYRAGASSFIIKPSTMESTRKKISTFFEYWFTVADTGTKLEVRGTNVHTN
jgi:response regulator RpfG family c-di-GMP phosphodiesterase